MQKPSIGWQSWSPAFPSWHGFPRWDYSPFSKNRPFIFKQTTTSKISPVRYWCSWYAYGWNINDKKISETLSIIKNFKLPFTHILIDDGWTTWGDWQTPNLTRFPDLKATISKIRNQNLKAGLWFAPFLANRRSKLFKDHPDWFIKHNGHYTQGLKTFPIWESFLPQQYLLNFELREVKQHIADFIDLAVSNWGISLLKLDFLYAPYYNPSLVSDDLPHKQVTWLLSYIKKYHPDITIIACGAPFSSSIGIADIIRISKDTALPPIIPSIINRHFYHHRVRMLLDKVCSSELLSNINLDPDVRIISLDNVQTQNFWTKISPKIKGIGDNLTKLSRENIVQIRSWLNH